MTMNFQSLNNDDRIRDINQLSSLYNEIKKILDLNPTVIRIAHELRSLIDKASPFIEANTSIVCPHCTRVCCINQHGYYEIEDLLYIVAIDEPVPDYKKDFSDEEPCQFLSTTGCVLERYRRPFRCNWYFCIPLIDNMQSHRGRIFREFNKTMQRAIDLRRSLIENSKLLLKTQTPAFVLK